MPTIKDKAKTETGKGHSQAVTRPADPVPYEPTDMVVKEVMFQKGMTREEAIAHLKKTRS